VIEDGYRRMWSHRGKRGEGENGPTEREKCKKVDEMLDPEEDSVRLRNNIKSGCGGRPARSKRFLY